jgi:hypothetical protein
MPQVKNAIMENRVSPEWSSFPLGKFDGQGSGPENSTESVRLQATRKSATTKIKAIFFMDLCVLVDPKYTTLFPAN